MKDNLITMSKNYCFSLADLKSLAIDKITAALIADASGKYVYVNKGWEHIMGLKASDVIGKKVKDFVPDSKVEETLKTGQPIYAYKVTSSAKESIFNNCIPLKVNKDVIGVLVVSFFTNMSEAIVFTEEVKKITDELSYYKEKLRKIQGARKSIDDIIGSSPATLKLKQQIAAAARTNSTVLIEGETGTGKELVANAIHDLSNRRENPFIKINCSAIPPNLFESELFGYEKGAFTGANQKGKRGLFESADSGSLFLDEINQLAYFVQPKLLRVLQEKEIRHVGSSQPTPVNVRIITATNKSLKTLINENLFREDLYYRLNVVTIRIPPLRERIGDIPELVESIRKRLNFELGTRVDGISHEAEQKLMAYNWPGNIRELNNVMERAMNAQINGVLTWDVFLPYFQSAILHETQKNNQKNEKAIYEPTLSTKNPFSLSDARHQTEKELIRTALLDNKYNKTKTAKALNISRSALYQKLHLYDID